MKAKTPMTSSYLRKFSGTPKLEPDDLQFYQELVGMLIWATELGRVDILHAVSLLYQYQAYPREGHLEQVLQILVEKYLGAMLFAQNIYNIYIYIMKCIILNNCSDYTVFYWLLFPQK